MQDQPDSSTSPPARVDGCRIVELRRYALHPGRRDTLIDLFDRELVEPQEAVGMRILGQFRDLDDPDSFVWLRGFIDMESRTDALAAFYGGPVWKQHARAANETMIDSDNVLLLRPVRGLDLDLSRRAPRGSTRDAPGVLGVEVWPLTTATAGDVPALFDRIFEPALHDAGVTVSATYATEHSENTFPALPVRTDEDVFVWMAIFDDEAEHARHMQALEGCAAWRDAWEAAASYVAGHPDLLRLSPTARSAIHA